MSYDDRPVWDDFSRTMEEQDAPSINLIAKWHDEGRTCAECGTEFVKAHGQPTACEFCKRRGSEYPVATHAEKNQEAHKQQARKRRQRRNNA